MTSHVLTDLADALARGAVTVIDLTQPLGPATPVIELPPMFAASPGVTIDVISKYDAKGPAWYWNTLTFGEHTGTHFDAPVHWITGKDLSENACDTIPARRFVGPACVIDVTKEAAADPDFLLEIEHVQQWEAEHGPLPEGGWLLYRTGWDARSASQEEFLNANETGPHTPGISVACAQWLAAHESIIGLGVETVGTDAGTAHSFDPPFPCHASLLGAGKYGLTQLQNLALLPPRGAVVIAGPLPITGGSGSPCRAIGLIERA